MAADYCSLVPASLGARLETDPNILRMTFTHCVEVAAAHRQGGHTALDWGKFEVADLGESLGASSSELHGQGWDIRLELVAARHMLEADQEDTLAFGG